MKAIAFLVVSLGFVQTASALAPRDIYNKSGAAVVLILGSDDGKTGSGGTGSIITKSPSKIPRGRSAGRTPRSARRTDSSSANTGRS